MSVKIKQATIPAPSRASSASTDQGVKASARVVPFKSGSQPTAELVMLTLDADGLIADYTSATERLFGYHRHQLINRHISMLLPKLGELPLTQGDYVNPRLAYLCRCGIPFRAKARDGDEFACELFVNRVGNSAASSLVLILLRINEPTLPCV